MACDVQNSPRVFLGDAGLAEGGCGVTVGHTPPQPRGDVPERSQRVPWVFAERSVPPVGLGGRKEGGTARIIPRHQTLLWRFHMIFLIPRFIFYDFLPASQCVSV